MHHTKKVVALLTCATVLVGCDIPKRGDTTPTNTSTVKTIEKSEPATKKKNKETKKKKVSLKGNILNIGKIDSSETFVERVLEQLVPYVEKGKLESCTGTILGMYKHPNKIYNLDFTGYSLKLLFDNKENTVIVKTTKTEDTITDYRISWDTDTDIFEIDVESINRWSDFYHIIENECKRIHPNWDITDVKRRLRLFWDNRGDFPFLYTPTVTKDFYISATRADEDSPMRIMLVSNDEIYLGEKEIAPGEYVIDKDKRHYSVGMPATAQNCVRFKNDVKPYVNKLAKKAELTEKQRKVILNQLYDFYNNGMQRYVYKKNNLKMELFYVEQNNCVRFTIDK